MIFLDCTRLENSKKLISRNKLTSVDVDNQIEIISSKLKENSAKEIILFDDVVYSGEVLQAIISKFKENGIKVVGIKTCIATNKSYEYFKNALTFGLECGLLLGDKVIDQVCERDFYFGIAQSGILTENEKGMICKAPYFNPFGNPCERASIPKEYEIDFSIQCLERSFILWEEIEMLSGGPIYVDKFPEKIIRTVPDETVLETIKGGIEKCKNYKLG